MRMSEGGKSVAIGVACDLKLYHAGYTRPMLDGSWITTLFTGSTSLTALFASAFLSATVLPGSSEVVLFAVLKAFPERAMAAIALATIGNTLGSLTTYGLGYLVPQRASEGRAVAWVRRYGAWSLLLAWLPVVGDALCAAAGWLRLPWLACLPAIAAGKLARYLVIAQAASLL